MGLIKLLLNIFINLIVPRNCYGCLKEGTYLCPKCLNSRLRISYIHKCHVCGFETRTNLVHLECQESTYLDGLLYACSYDSIVKKMIHDIKYNLCFDIIPTLSSIMAEYLKFYKFEDDFVLTSVPLHNSKKKVRGFNQAELLARGISDIRNIPYSELLIRSVKTKTQVGLKKSARESNLKGSFRVNNCLLESKQIRSVMVIDDVFTTGATLSECAKKLKESGVEKVYGFVLAKSRQ